MPAHRIHAQQRFASRPAPGDQWLIIES